MFKIYKKKNSISSYLVFVSGTVYVPVINTWPVFRLYFYFWLQLILLLLTGYISAMCSINFKKESQFIKLLRHSHSVKY